MQATVTNVCEVCFGKQNRPSLRFHHGLRHSCKCANNAVYVLKHPLSLNLPSTKVFCVIQTAFEFPIDKREHLITIHIKVILETWR